MSTTSSNSVVLTIGVRGAVTPATASLLEDFEVTSVGDVSILETVMPFAGRCSGAIARLQAIGLEVVELHSAYPSDRSRCLVRPADRPTYD